MSDSDEIIMSEEEWGEDAKETIESFEQNTRSRSSSQQVMREFENLGFLDSPPISGEIDCKQLLKLFKKKNNTVAKKEYIRCKVIRGHKRMNRQICSKVIPCKTLNRFDSNNECSIKNWKKMIEIYNNHISFFRPISQTQSGPLVDGKNKRTVSIGVQKSYNNKYCSEYFENSVNRESYHYYIELLFSDFDPELLCNKLELFCCRRKEHTSECASLWEKMKSYMQFGLIQELGITPHQLHQAQETPQVDDIDQFINGD